MGSLIAVGAFLLGPAVSRSLAASLAPSTVSATGFPFPRPASIEPNIKFWVDVFSAYSERDFLIHDRDCVWRIYQVLHLPGEGAPGRGEIDSVNDYLKTKFSGILNRLASGQAPADYEERQVAALFKGEPLSAYALAAQNLRVQQGMREEFREGLLRSRYYRSTMERIFSDADLPPELVTLAEVESGFYNRARSDAGAVGIWQFTRGTGRQFMRITRYHDDRLDPTTETEAAAKLLRSNYLTFGNWPLAITAYNYGTAGMEQAAEQYQSDYGRILRSYDGPHFGFASKNYYPEFLAALQIHRYENVYFPDIEYAEAPPPPVVRTDFTPPRRHHSRIHRVAYHHSHRSHRHRMVHRVSYHHRHTARR
ncbi:MAG TPA: lytic transglycosylase domain-containing protein, partial [Candidatus Binataceae bacterium]|nr:lytic transglycosylase domain-containing protein [Candidatus Binataceae bacterium]